MRVEPLITVIIPVYNVENYLNRCVKSVIDQTYKNLEIILINDGSVDHSKEICDDLSTEDKRIIVLHQTNQGVSAARNAGLEIMTGEFLFFLDSDDFMHIRCLEILYKLCMENHCSIAQCLYEQGKERDFTTNCINLEGRGYSAEEFLSNRFGKITVCGKLYKSYLFKNIRFPIGKIYEDEFITYKIVWEAKYVLILNQKLYYRYLSPNSITRNKKLYICLDFIDAYKERISFFSKKNRKLQNSSKKEFCIRLMLYYIKCKNQKNNQNDKKELLNYFNHYYNEVDLDLRKIKEKIILKTFSLFPNLTASMVRIFKLK